MTKERTNTNSREGKQKVKGKMTEESYTKLDTCLRWIAKEGRKSQKRIEKETMTNPFVNKQMR